MPEVRRRKVKRAEGHQDVATDTYYASGILQGTDSRRRYALLTIFAKNERIFSVLSADFSCWPSLISRPGAMIRSPSSTYRPATRAFSCSASAAKDGPERAWRLGGRPLMSVINAPHGRARWSAIMVEFPKEFVGRDRGAGNRRSAWRSLSAARGSTLSGSVARACVAAGPRAVDVLRPRSFDLFTTA